ncbi:integrase, catalytic region, zinc finger, CCHC-type containing protein [Tanacetum coccineum]|uniref:Integrase, catalytic region, zinc finger, CCHC-type containing protein n=1 Tax=Tanacetum coccineum TaxID=301880 RepID=A0ABQ5DKZ5_9ASTR
MSTSKTYQQSLADAGSKTRPPMLERGPYQFEMFIPNNSTVPKLLTAEDLQGDALLHYDVEMELMNLILLSIPNDIYNSVDACTLAKDMWKRVERLMRGTIQNKVDKETLDMFVIFLRYYLQQFEKLVNVSRAKKLEKFMSFGSVAPWVYFQKTRHDYQQDDVHTNSEDPLTFCMNSGNAGRNNRRAYVQEEIIKGSNAPNETENVQRTLRTSSSGNTSTVQCYNCSGKGHYARNCPKPRDGRFKELSTNICLMAKIQPANNTSDAGPSYDSAFISEVQSSSNTENEEQMYPTHTKIINSTISDDQIDSDIIFDSSNGNVNSGSIEKDTHVPDLCNSEISLNVRDTEDTLDDASKSQQKVYEKMNDPIAVANKQNCWTIDYAQINALYKDFVPQKKLSAEQKYFPSSLIPSDKNSNATPSIPVSMPSESPLIIELDKIKNCFQRLSELIQKNCKRASIFYTSPEEIQLDNFCQDQLKPMVNELQFYFEFFKTLF